MVALSHLFIIPSVFSQGTIDRFKMSKTIIQETILINRHRVSDVVQNMVCLRKYLSLMFNINGYIDPVFGSSG